MIKILQKWFTLVELTISVLILSIIIIWISTAFMQISQNFSDSTYKTNIFEQIKEFNFDTNIFKYNTWIVYTWWILLYNNNNWLLIWSFLNENWWYDYIFDYNDDIYNEYLFWYFILNQNTLSWVLNSSLDINTLKYNNWKIYNKLIIKDLDIKQYNTEEIIEMNLEIFKNYNTILNEKNKSEEVIQKEDYIKFNFNF